MKKSEKINKIVEKLMVAENIAFFHHIIPDGDAISSSYALLKALAENYPDKKLRFMGDIEYINTQFPFVEIDDKYVCETISEDENWTVIIGDTSNFQRIYKNEEFSKGKTKLCFDHHLSKSNIELDVIWQDHTFAASAIQSWQIAQKMCKKISSKTALLFFFGILTDTGNFMFSLNDLAPYQAAIEIMKFVKREDIDAFYRNMRVQTIDSIRVEQWILNNFKIKNKLAYCVFYDDDLKKLGKKPSQLYQVNRLANIQGCSIWAFIIENKKENCFKLSLRSNGKSVHKFASKYKGGGHERAAGIKIALNKTEIVSVINDLIEYSGENE